MSLRTLPLLAMVLGLAPVSEVQAQVAAGLNYGVALDTDQQAPTVQISTPLADQKLFIAKFNGETISGTATDNFGVTSVKLKLYRTRNDVNEIWNGSSFTTKPATVEATRSGSGHSITWNMGASAPSQSALNAGGYVVIAYATDAAGHISQTRRSFTLLDPDTQKPSVYISIPQPNQKLLISSVAGGTINGDAGDNVGVVSVRIKLYRSRGGVNQVWNGSTFSATPTTVSADLLQGPGVVYWYLKSQAPPATQLDNGIYIVEAYATDSSGNTGAARQTFTVLQSASVNVLSWGSDYPDLPTDITNVGDLIGKDVLKSEAGDSHRLALCSDGSVVAWGDNSFGQIGTGADDFYGQPIDITSKGALKGKTVIAISAGGRRSLALCSDGALVSWGETPGNGSQKSNIPIDISEQGALKGKTVTAIAAGSQHTLAVCSDGSAVAWGDNSYGQLGDGSVTPRSVPVSVSRQSALGGKAVTAVSAGALHSLALCSDGTLLSWGGNGLGQLGSGNFNQRSLPGEVVRNGVLQGKTIRVIEAGSANSFALCSDGTVAAWGERGTLGDGSIDARNAPVDITSSGGLKGKRVTQLAAGFAHVLALCSDGTVLAWGYNATGSLGTGTDGGGGPVTRPVVITGNGDLRGKVVTQLAAGGSQSLALARFSAIPTVRINRPGDNERFSPDQFVPGFIVGDFTDDKGITGVQLKLYRVRSGVTEIWNGTSFTTTSTTVAAAKLDEAPNGRWSWQTKAPTPSQMQPGTYFLIAYAADKDGHTTTDRVSFFVQGSDNKPPTVSISSPTLNASMPISTFKGGTIAGTASDNVGITGVTIQLKRTRGDLNTYWNGTEFVAQRAFVTARLIGDGTQWTFDRDFPRGSSLDAGEYVVTAAAYDPAGFSAVTAPRTFTLTAAAAVADGSGGHS